MRQIKIFSPSPGANIEEKVNAWLRGADVPESDKYIEMVYPDQHGGFVVVYQLKQPHP